MLWQRILTALILIFSAVLVIGYLPSVYFGFATAFLLTLVAWEWANLTGIINTKQRLLYIMLIWVALALAAIIPPIIVLSVGAIVWIGALYFVYYYPNINKNLLINWPGCLLSILILVNLLKKKKKTFTTILLSTPEIYLNF